jgi:hypothetical protein
MTADERAELDALWHKAIAEARESFQARAALGLEPTEPEGEENRRLCKERNIRRDGKSTGIAMMAAHVLYGDTDSYVVDAATAIPMPDTSLRKNARKRAARRTASQIIIIEDYQPTTTGLAGKE